MLPDATAVAQRAAGRVARRAREAVARRGAFHLAVSGGSTPWRMLEALAGEEVPWRAVHLFQVDERIAPRGDPDRNWTRVEEVLLDRVPLPESHRHPMPVEGPDLEAGAAAYARELAGVAGEPPVLDLVHLGLGEDGHTASLLPGDAVLSVSDADVALTTGAREGRRRMTLTYPAIARAREVLWLVTGASKAPMLRRLEAGDASIPAGRIRREAARVLADAAAATPDADAGAT